MAEPDKVIPSIWTTGWTDVINTGTWRNAMPVHQRRPAPCHQACTVNGEIPTWIRLAREHHFYDAWLAIVANNPFPAVTGRVCHHPCEGSCNRAEYDGSVAINALEQFIGDLALQEYWELPLPETNNTQRVAVVGGGPCGLACAYQLRMLGYQVTILEAQAQLGGVLRYGIPAYRLPKEVLDGEIVRIIALGIEVQTNRSVSPRELGELEKEYDAVFLAMGAKQAKRPPLWQENTQQVLDGLHFLTMVNRGISPQLGKQVVVIGGGSVAMDVARTARRLGSQVKVIALENRLILPAQADEVREALEEGIVLVDGTMVQNSLVQGERLELHCTKVALDQSVYPGVIKPIVLPGTEFKFSTDKVIVAVGQMPDLTGWDAEVGIADGLIEVEAGGITSHKGVFAGGDVASSERYVSNAIGQGKQAAFSIARYLETDSTAGQESLTGQESSTGTESVSYRDINTFYFPLSPREEKGLVAVPERLGGFAEVKIGLTAGQASAQSERCFSCGNCVECDNCFYFCPDMAVVKDSSLEEHYRILDQYCKGCGCCVEECPRGAVVLEEAVR